MKYVGTYSCGYRGCDEILYLEAETDEQVNAYMRDGLADYIASYEYMISDDIEDLDDDEDGEVDFYDTAEYEDFYANCSYDFHPATKDDIEDAAADGFEWVDIT